MSRWEHWQWAVPLDPGLVSGAEETGGHPSLSGGSESYRHGYSHSLMVQEAESLGIRSKKEGPGGVT